jgi:hypothetical protein
VTLLVPTAAWQAAVAPTTPSPPTFSEHIAPIVYANCLSCHRPDEAAPFSLISYEDVAKRGRQIARVTASRYMPPWHAVHGYGDFVDERRLSDEQIAVIGDWVAQGMPRGDASQMPPLPTFTDGWQLGQPDVVLEMPEAFEVPADGADIYRNFALPMNLGEDKWIRAIEFRPDPRSVVHHALFMYVRAGSTASLVKPGAPAGFDGAMPASFVPAFAPGGDLGVWTVGMTPRALPEGFARRLPKASDVVAQLHLHPTGKVERVRARVGLYFASVEPERKFREYGVPGLFGALAKIDIPPGEKNYVVNGSLTLPANMEVISVMAHAHYLGKEIKATATRPDGRTEPMLWIRNWDFNWQDRYIYKTPVLLPKGTRIDVSISYDNSADNPNNPCNPPRRVRFGLQSTDEMANVRFQVVPATTQDQADTQAFGAAIAAGLRNAAQQLGRGANAPTASAPAAPAPAAPAPAALPPLPLVAEPSRDGGCGPAPRALPELLTPP